MDDYFRHQTDQAIQRATATVPLLTRVSEAERAGIQQLAGLHDRTLSREARRAIRYYLSHFDEVDRVLREQAIGGGS